MHWRGLLRNHVFSCRCINLFVAGLLLVAALSVFAPASIAHAHTVRPAVVNLMLNDSGADEIEIQVEIKASVEVWLAGISPDYSDTNDSPNAAEYDRLRSLEPTMMAAEFAAYATEFIAQLELNVDGVQVPLSYSGIDVSPEPDPELARISQLSLSAKLPSESSQLIWVWPQQYGSNVLRISRQGSEDIYSIWLKRGMASEPYLLSGESTKRTRMEVALNYLAIGYEHIVPKGLDHILFVVGIFLLSIRLTSLLWQVTAFTIAHTITLGLSIYGLISAPASLVEPLIALSIAYVGIENCLSSKLQPWRVVLVFCFGLLHGMGFAGVLNEIGLPPAEFLTALITFNVGVELGQLSVILLCFVLVGWWRHKDWYRQRIVIPASLMIAIIGLYWTWERAFV
jgi:hydrogenase/urease accessory protein HupE